MTGSTWERGKPGTWRFVRFTAVRVHSFTPKPCGTTCIRELVTSAGHGDRYCRLPGAEEVKKTRATRIDSVLSNLDYELHREFRS
jgi:hypothetical protein